ncbi:MAG TPA: type II secretion system F family protein [Candidatus Paceibacterota bacterium]
MIFLYKALDQNGQSIGGTVDAISIDVAIASLQRRGLTISSIDPEGARFSLSSNISLFEGVSNRDLVILSRQIATLFEAQVSALRTFRLLAEQSDKPLIKRALTDVSDDLQAGNPISKALSKHPKVFSDFYVNMVRSGEESGKLDQTFQFLADYLDRSYELLSKARNALIYPAFVMATFIAVMVLMLTLVIPRISAILIESGQDIPIYTKIVISLSSFLTDYGVFLLATLIIGGFFMARYARTEGGGKSFSRLKLTLPYIGNLYQKLYLSRIADNMQAMLGSGIPAVRALEITANVVGNKVYADILFEAIQSVKTGNPVSETFARYPEIPSIMVQMLQVGEETGEMGTILDKLARFYRREVNNAVDTLVNLIEPVLIVALALGVGVLLSSVLIPIYNISGAI